MPGMPEIVGDSQSGALEAAERLEEGREVRPLRSTRVAASLLKPGIHVSPLRLRLNDFSGEGERAPPGV